MLQLGQGVGQAVFIRVQVGALVPIDPGKAKKEADRRSEERSGQEDMLDPAIS